MRKYPPIPILLRGFVFRNRCLFCGIYWEDPLGGGCRCERKSYFIILLKFLSLVSNSSWFKKALLLLSILEPCKAPDFPGPVHGALVSRLTSPLSPQCPSLQPGHRHGSLPAFILKTMLLGLSAGYPRKWAECTLEPGTQQALKGGLLRYTMQQSC